MFKKIIQTRLETYVRKYFAAHPEVKLVAVAGSVGKTSTKRAIGTLLAERYRVRMHTGNHNSEISIPLAVLGIDYPSNIHNPIAWLAIFRAASARIHQPADVDVVVQELGTDHPGDLATFGTYLAPDIAVVAAVTPEHMEFFGAIEAVATEELSVASYSKLVLINREDIEGRFAQFENNPNINTYGTTGIAEYRYEQSEFTPTAGYVGQVSAPEYPESFAATVRVVGEHSLRPIAGAIAVAAKMGLTPDEITKGLAKIRSVPGRMNLLRGIGDTTIIDDSYNSSPAAAAAALQTLYSFGDASQRIAILGDMRELGAVSRAEHEKLGKLCDGGLLAWVVTVGPETEKYLAPAARAKGCQVKSFVSAIAAAEFVRRVTEPGAVILAKGSQNTIFLEEAVKQLCELSEDDELVRQTPAWLEMKQRFFDQIS